MFKTLALLAASPLRLKVLTNLLRSGEEEQNVASVAATLRAPREQVSKELKALARAKILLTRSVKRTLQYRANDTHPLTAPLRAFFAETTNPSDRELTAAFRGVRGLALLVASGALVNDDRGNVDLLIVSRNPENAHIERAVKRVEALAAIPIRYAVLELRDYLERRQAYDRLLRDVFEYRHKIVIERSSAG